MLPVVQLDCVFGQCCERGSIQVVTSKSFTSMFDKVVSRSEHKSKVFRKNADN